MYCTFNSQFEAAKLCFITVQLGCLSRSKMYIHLKGSSFSEVLQPFSNHAHKSHKFKFKMKYAYSKNIMKERVC
jgi:hypothetical protein